MRKAKRQARTVKNPDSMTLGILGGVGILALVGVGVYFATRNSQASMQTMIDGPTSTPQLNPQDQTPTQQIQQPQTQQANTRVNNSRQEQRTVAGFVAGSRARRNQSFHLRETDTASNRGSLNITDNPTLELITRGTSTRNANEQMWQVRIVDGPNAGRIGWTFLLPNEQIS
jgi:hypothetical protein